MSRIASEFVRKRNPLAGGCRVRGRLGAGTSGKGGSWSGFWCGCERWGRQVERIVKMWGPGTGDLPRESEWRLSGLSFRFRFWGCFWVIMVFSVVWWVCVMFR